MKTATALLSLALTLCFSLQATAQEQADLSGSWQAESVNSTEPTDGTSLELEFNKTLKLTYTTGDESQSWEYGYSVTEGQLILEPLNPFGDPDTITYDIKIDEGKLLLLTPKPAPAEDETEEGEEEEEEEEEEDTRVPVWVLVKA